MGDCLMATLKINGDTSGYVELVSPAVSGSTSIELDKILVADSSGNVGIGTTNPTNLLHVKSTTNNGGVITIESTATNSYPFLRLKNDAREYQITAHGPLSDIFTIYDGTAGSHRLVISSSGNEIGRAHV